MPQRSSQGARLQTAARTRLLLERKVIESEVKFLGYSIEDAEGFMDDLWPNPIAIHDDDGIALLGHRHYPQVTVLSTRTEHEASVDECRTGVRQSFLSSSNYLPFGTVRLNYGSCPQSCASRTTELGRINGIFSESRICRRLFPRTESDQSGSCPAETELSFRPNRLGSLG